jgi:transposase
LWWDGTGICLLTKRLENSQFHWPAIADGMMQLTPAQSRQIFYHCPLVLAWVA